MREGHISNLPAEDDWINPDSLPCPGRAAVHSLGLVALVWLPNTRHPGSIRIIHQDLQSGEREKKELELKGVGAVPQ